MLEINWNNTSGWETPIIKPYSNLEIDPAASVFHYGLECFEGMKAYKVQKQKQKRKKEGSSDESDDGNTTDDREEEIRLFRPELNMNRMNKSMERLYLPKFNNTGFLECIKQLILLDSDWIPTGDGYSLYIRPTGISTHPYIGVGESKYAKLFVILSPVGPYYSEGLLQPIKLYADTSNVRAWPFGGTGNTKIGGNYGPTIKPQIELANSKGYSQILWLFPQLDDTGTGQIEHYLTEVGTMNLFIYWINETTGRKELVTAPISRGDILPGVTRQSIIELCQNNNGGDEFDDDFDVIETTITMKQVVKALEDNRLIEIFGSGTAAVITPVSTIHYNNVDYQIPCGDDGIAGDLTLKLYKAITDIQYGRNDNNETGIPHPWSPIIN